MKKIALLFTFALLSAPLLKAQDLILPILPSAHNLSIHQPAWYQEINQYHEFSLATGFNWWSSYIDLSDNGLLKLENSLGSDAVLIKSSNPFNQYDAISGGWTGNLQSLDNGSMYIIQLASESNTYQIEGSVVNLSEVEINISQGWNWIGFPSASIISLEDALANYTPSNNDMIKGQDNSATYSTAQGKWEGRLTELVPGNGYLLLSNGEATSFHFANSSKDEPTEIHHSNTIWKADPHAFAMNMNVLATVKLFGNDVKSEDYELGVFLGDECRGTVQLMTVNSSNNPMAFLTAYGNEGDALQFRLLDRLTGTVYTTEHQPIIYNDNAVVGTLDAPCEIEFRNLLSCEETLAGMLNVYPNPMNSQQSLTVTLPENQTYAEGVRIQVINLLGQVVKEETMTGNRCSINGLSSGMYTLRVLAGNALIYNNKLIVK